MTTFFTTEFHDFSGEKGLITISTGPVVVHSDGERILLHVSSTTGKYQFIGGRLDDSLSFRENALQKAQEVVGNNLVQLTSSEPTVLLDSIIRDGKSEKILLVHYRASIQDENSCGDAKWFTLREIEELHKENKTSSPNILICSKHFLS